MSVSPSTRTQAYLEILQRGLLVIRATPVGGSVELWQIEADHLHNIPTLLDEDNPRRHEYYIQAERTSYLRQLRAAGATEYLESAAIWYYEPWQTLAAAAGVTLDI